jgi:hypothetical protein
VTATAAPSRAAPLPLAFLPRTAAGSRGRPPRAPTKAVNLRSWIAAPPGARPRGLKLDHRLPERETAQEPEIGPRCEARARTQRHPRRRTATRRATKNRQRRRRRLGSDAREPTGSSRSVSNGSVCVAPSLGSAYQRGVRRARMPYAKFETCSFPGASCPGESPELIVPEGLAAERLPSRKAAPGRVILPRTGGPRSTSTAGRAVGRGTTTVVQNYVFHRTSSFRNPGLTLKDVRSSVKSRMTIAARHRCAFDALRARPRTSLV